MIIAALAVWPYAAYLREPKVSFVQRYANCRCTNTLKQWDGRQMESSRRSAVLDQTSGTKYIQITGIPNYAREVQGCAVIGSLECCFSCGG